MSHNDSSVYNKERDANKRNYKLRFYGTGNNYAFLDISPEIISKLRLTESDTFTEEFSDDDAIIIRRTTRT